MAGKREITPDLYNRLVEAFRLKPGIYTFAARVCGVEHRTAKRAWMRGWASPHKKWAIAIKDLFEQEQEKLRADRMKAIEEQARIEEEQVLKAQEDAKTTLQQEAEGVRQARVAAMIFTKNILPPIIRGAVALAARLETDLAKLDDMNPTQRMLFLRNTASVINLANNAMQTALENERLRLGQPTQVIGVKAVEKMTPEEAARELEFLAQELSGEVGAVGEVKH